MSYHSIRHPAEGAPFERTALKRLAGYSRVDHLRNQKAKVWPRKIVATAIENSSRTWVSIESRDCPHYGKRSPDHIGYTLEVFRRSDLEGAAPQIDY